MIRSKLVFISTLILLFNFGAAAQEEYSEENLAKITTNPIANMISLPFQFNFNFNAGEYGRYGTVLNLQPVIPYRLNKKWNVVNRIIIPLMQKPDTAATGSTYGIGNTVISMFFTPAQLKKMIWGIGPAFYIPTSSAPELGGDAFGIGPSIILMYMMGDHWAFGLNANQTWSYKTSDHNSFFGQYMIIYNLKKGWFINTMPTITANFNKVEGEQWLVPFGAGGGKVENIGKQAFKFQLQYYYNVIKPSAAAQWSIQATIFALFPKNKMSERN